MSISTVTSESLQLKLRQLLPSQQGFGTDLSASDTIIPVIDLTAAAEGSDTPQNLQTALAFGSQTEFSAENSTALIANTTGFYQIVGTSSMKAGGTVNTNSITMTDGAATKTVWAHKMRSGSTEAYQDLLLDYVFFLRAGDSVSAVSSITGNYVLGSVRQIADVNGTLVAPVGFTPS